VSTLGEAAGKSPNQSNAVAFGMFAHVTVTVPPGPTVDGVTVRESTVGGGNGEATMHEAASKASVSVLSTASLATSAL
jgi:hypothetical protein